MKKAIVGLAAVAGVVGLLVAARRVSHELREHSKQMKAHCKQMKAHCKEMMASSGNGSSEVPSQREVNEIKKKRAAAPTA
jgi:gas vesicle protein